MNAPRARRRGPLAVGPSGVTRVYHPLAGTQLSEFSTGLGGERSPATPEGPRQAPLGGLTSKAAPEGFRGRKSYTVGGKAYPMGRVICARMKRPGRGGAGRLV